MLSPWSVVDSVPSEAPIELTKKSGSSVTHTELIEYCIPEARDGHWYYNKYYLGSGDVQTVLASSDYEAEYPVWYGRRTFLLDDGAQISIDYSLRIGSAKPDQWDEDVKYIPDSETPRLPKRTRILRPEEVRSLDDPYSTKPLFINIHGLTGGSHENYLRATICEVEKLHPGEIEYAVITSRGCNRSKITTPQLFNAAWTEDLRTFVKHVTNTQPKRPIFLAGYSLGASILANYLGQEGREVTPAIKAAMVVANPWDLLMSHLSIISTFLGRNVYFPQMGSNLKRLVKNNRKVMEESSKFREQAKLLPQTKTVFDFDNALTAPLFGFADATEYYRSCSSVQLVDNISVPTLILAAKDDPICADASVPYGQAPKNPYTHIVSTTHGGHLGWFSSDGKRWFATVISKYISSFIEEVDLTRQLKAPPLKEKWFRNHRFQQNK